MNEDNDSPQLLVSAANDFEAAAIITALSEMGIQATALGGYTAGFIAEAPGDVSVVVKSSDLAAAKAALKEIIKNDRSIDWSKVDVGDPEPDDVE